MLNNPRSALAFVDAVTGFGTIDASLGRTHIVATANFLLGQSAQYLGASDQPLGNPNAPGQLDDKEGGGCEGVNCKELFDKIADQATALVKALEEVERECGSAPWNHYEFSAGCWVAINRAQWARYFLAITVAKIGKCCM